MGEGWHAVMEDGGGVVHSGGGRGEIAWWW